MHKRLLATLCFLAGTAANAQQHAPIVSLEAGGLYATADGDDFEGTNPGVGFDAQGRVRFRQLSVGAGFQRTSHDVDEVSDNIIATGFFVEPRFHIPTGSDFTPFIVSRFGSAKQSIETDVPNYGSAEFESSGWMFGVGAGLEFAVSPTAHLNVMATYSRISFGDIEVEGDRISDSDSEGSSIMLRVGFSFALNGRR